MCFDSRVIRLAVPSETERLMQIEDEAGRLYASVGLPADLPGMPRQMVERAIADGLLWVIADERETPIGFAMCWLRPDAIHLRELDVHPDHMRRGHGGCLLEHISKQAAERGLGYVTLTTFSNVPWNAPYYRRHGFESLRDDSLPAWLAEIRRAELRLGLDAWPREAMQRAVFGG